MDILHQENRIYLVFEFMSMDLKKYMETIQGSLRPMIVKVSHLNQFTSILSVF